jgi:hypothetical protein
MNDSSGCGLNEEFKNSIKTIFTKLDENNINGVLVGSCNQALQGMKSNPRDLDVIENKKDLEKVRELFSEFDPGEIKEKPVINGVRAWELSFVMNGVEVQFIGESEIGNYVRGLNGREFIHVSLEGVKIPCFKLEYEVKAYRIEQGRESKNGSGFSGEEKLKTRLLKEQQKRDGVSGFFPSNQPIHHILFLQGLSLNYNMGMVKETDESHRCCRLLLLECISSFYLFEEENNII